MSWLFPGFLAATALVGLPILLHFLRGKPRDIIPFPTLRFLGPSAIHETRRHRIRRWLTLLMRCALIGLLAAAFARPFWAKPPSVNISAVVIAVDNSFSMAAGQRWPKLKSWSITQLAALKPGDRAGLLLMNPSPHWLVRMTDNLNQVRDTLAVMNPGWEITHYDPALRLAGEALAQTPARQRALVWMGDQQRLGWTGVDFQKPLPAGVKIIFSEAQPSVAQQAAITRLQVGSTDRKFTVDASVRLFEPAAAKRTLVLRDGTKELGRQEIDLQVGADQHVNMTIPKEPSQTELALTATLEPGDDLTADDTAYAVCQGDQGATVLLAPDTIAEGEADYLAHAIDSMGAIPELPFHRVPLPSTAWSTRSIAMLRGETAFQPSQVKLLDQFLSDGGTAWIWVDGSNGQKAWLTQHQVQITALPLETDSHHWQDFDVDSPLLADFAQNGLLPLLRIEFQTAYSLQATGLEPLANWENKTAAMGVMPVGKGRIVLCGFAPTRAASNWPGQASFVPFLHQMLTALSEAGTMMPSIHVGQPLALPAETGSWTKKAGPDTGAQQAIEKGVVTPITPGIYEFHSGTSTWLYAVNVDTQESDLTPWPQQSDWLALESKAQAPKQTTLTTMANVEQGAQQNTWWWLVAFALVLLPLELTLSNRTSL